MISSDDLTFFQVVARSATLAEAARKLNVTPPAVTQRLRALEGRIGVTLMERTSRSLSLTDEGALVFSEGANILGSIGDLSEQLLSRTRQVKGHLRIAAPHGFGRRYVAPVTRAFVEKHPAVTLTLELSDNPIRLLSESWDIVVHIGLLNESDRLVTTLAPNRRILCAAPDYLERHSRIESPSDLVKHRCLALRENEEDVTLWRFIHASLGAATVRVQPSMASNDGAVILEWALAGLGVMVRSEWDVADDLAAGHLQEVLPKWSPNVADVVALLHSRHGRSSRTAAFLDMLRTSLIPAPWRVGPS